MAYIDLLEMKDYLGQDIEGDEDRIEAAIDAAQKGIESMCKTRFEGSTGTRYYREQDLKQLSGLGPGIQKVLWLGEDLLSVSTLTNGDATVVASTSYWLEPRNKPPYQYIRLRSDESWVFNTDGEVEVAGTWGFSTAADPMIREVTREYAAYLYRLKDSQVFDTIAQPDMGIITIPQGLPRHMVKALEQGGYVRHVRFA